MTAPPDGRLRCRLALCGKVLALGRQNGFWLANVKVTHTLAQAAGRLNIPGLSISPPAVYFDFQHHYDLPETYLARAFSSHYASGKYAAERVIAGAVSRYSATRFILLRPRGLFGPHDQVIVPRLMQQLQQGGGCLRLPRRGDALWISRSCKTWCMPCGWQRTLKAYARAVFTTSAITSRGYR